MMRIHYLKNKEIDKKRWDEIIDKSPNGRIYAYSWYLDALTENCWDALILGDYDFIMPIPWRSKYGIHYIYTPPFIQQLGIFSEKTVPGDLFLAFLKNLPIKFKLLNLCVNTHEKLPLTQKIRTNFILNINKPYEEIWKNYKASAKKKIKKERNVVFLEKTPIKNVITDYIRDNGHQVNYTKEDYLRLEKAMTAASEHDCLISCRLENDTNETLASAFFPVSHGRVYHLFGSQTVLGRETQANHFLIDNLIKKYCQKIQLYDFAGSDLPGVAEFIKKWGSTPEYYSNIKTARFPFNLICKK
jgi:hypothetical protein